MVRRQWGSLSDNYRKRLQRAGIDQAAYEQGVSLSAARGHAATPEHPIEGPVPEKYTKWYNARHGVPIRMLTGDGEKWLSVSSRKSRGWIGSHWNAVNAYLFGKKAPAAWWWNGDSRRSLDAFENRTVSGREIYPDNSVGPLETWDFMTDPDDVEDWTFEDVVSFAEIYRPAA